MSTPATGWFGGSWPAGSDGAGPSAALAARSGPQPASGQGITEAADQAGLVAQVTSVWTSICDQFGLQLLVLAEQLRTSLDDLEADEDDPERLQRLYQVDHAVTRMRRTCRDLRTLAGRSEEELAGVTSSLLDVIRMATSAIERYTQVSVGRVTDLAVLGYVADDVGSLLAALLDNATRYSPGTVTVSAHLLQDGAVMFRIEDTGIGIGEEQVAMLNATFASPVSEVDDRTGRHTGFPVVHRLARKHSIAVRLAARPMPSSGTVVMVTLPPHLLCEVPPASDANQWLPSASNASARPSQPPRPSAVPDLSQRERPAQPAPPRRSGVSELPVPGGPPGRQRQPAQPRQPDHDQQARLGELPRRESVSLRGDAPRRPAAVRSPRQQAAARRAFAEDLGAFSTGSAAQPRPGGAGSAAPSPPNRVAERALGGTEIEEGTQI